MIAVGSMWCIFDNNWSSHGWARIGCTYLWRSILLDVQILVAEMEMPAIVDSRMWVTYFSVESKPFSFSYIYTDANSVGNIAGLASIDWGCAIQIMAAASIGSGMQFQPTTAQTLYVACRSYSSSLAKNNIWFLVGCTAHCSCAMELFAAWILLLLHDSKNPTLFWTYCECIYS